MFNQDFKEFFESLNANHVRYLVVGGYVQLQCMDIHAIPKTLMYG